MPKRLRFRPFCNVLLLLLIPLSLSAQPADSDTSAYQFSPIKTLAHTPVKSQGRTGTCWCFATVSLLESEVLRQGLDEVDLSEMFLVRHTYTEKAKAYIRWHGHLNFGQGSMMHLAIQQMRDFGLVTEAVYTGKHIGLDTYHNGEVHTVVKAMLDGVLKARKPTPQWQIAVDQVLNTYLGTPPQSFKYNDTEMTPVDFRDRLKLNADDYIEITSIARAPFYTQVLSEFPDNWDFNDDYYNLPVEEIPGVIEEAIEKGYTVVYAGDVSGKHFSTRKTGYGIVPVDSANFSLNEPVEEKTITQAMRAELFENFTTTDDHAMHIVGTARDQKGHLYFYTKNSHGTDRKFDGYVYLSEAYVQLNMNSLLLNKNALDKALSKKLHIQ